MNVKFKKGKSENLKNLTIEPGTLYLTTDLHELFIGTSSGKKKIVDKCTFYQIPYFTILDKDSLSKAVGKGNISSVGVKSIGGANKIINMLKEDIYDGER